MRTTIDIPEDLLRKAKSEAALRGMKLKEYVAQALRSALFRKAPSARARDRESGPVAGEPKLVLGDKCVFPLIRGKGGPALRGLTSEKIHRILEEEDIERALRSGGR